MQDAEPGQINQPVICAHAQLRLLGPVHIFWVHLAPPRSSLLAHPFRVLLSRSAAFQCLVPGYLAYLRSLLRATELLTGPISLPLFLTLSRAHHDRRSALYKRTQSHYRCVHPRPPSQSLISSFIILPSPISLPVTTCKRWIQLVSHTAHKPRRTSTTRSGTAVDESPRSHPSIRSCSSSQASKHRRTDPRVPTDTLFCRSLWQQPYQPLLHTKPKRRRQGHRRGGSVPKLGVSCPVVRTSPESSRRG